MRRKEKTARRLASTCDSCGEGFQITEFDIGTDAEWTCIPCCDKLHREFVARHGSKNSPFKSGK